MSTVYTRVFALLVAAIFALGLVPTGALGAPTANSTNTGQHGVLGTDTGTITIKNGKVGETYSVYRLFELASFDDEEPQAGQHGERDKHEAYSYVIQKPASEGTDSWYTFLTTYGPAGSSDVNKYAILSNANGASSNASAYFIIDANPVTIPDANGTDATYYTIRANPNNLSFNNMYDDTSVLTDPTIRDGQGAAVANPDTAYGPGTTEDYANETGYSAVQNFAQEALKYAADKSLAKATQDVTGTGGEQVLMPDAPLGYYLVGTSMGTLAALDTTNRMVDIYEKNDEPAIEKKVLKKASAIPASDSAMTAAWLSGLTDGNGATASTYDWVDNTDADVGDYVLFRTVITAQQGADRYVLHDIMENGLTFVNETVATIGEKDRYTGKTDKDYGVKVYLVAKGDTPSTYLVPATATASGVADGVNYTVNSAPTDGCDFEIAFSDFGGAGAGNDKVQLAVTPTGGGSTLLYDIKDGDKLVVTYWAQVNQNAVVYNNTANQNGAADSEKEAAKASHVAPSIATNEGQTQISVPDDVKKDNNSDERNTNHTVLTYGAESYTKFEKATVTTYQFDVVKTNEYTGDTTSLLQGAEFNLFRATVVTSGEDYTLNSVKYKKEGSALPFAKNAVNEYKFNSDTAATADNVKLTSATDHEIHIEGLEAGTYLLVETKAPEGYNKLANPVVITINGGADDNTTSSPSPGNEGTISTAFTPNSGTAVTANDHAWDAVVTAGTPATYGTTNNGGIQVVNQTGQELPSTGGIGTTIFYVVGGILVAGSGVLLITKRRMSTGA
ncbi:MAG: LPXTG cell wall anchor domain-containing protein [Atopobiaceae bacterium]|nr:LPXTG cell wall anchor domain-containing protein [Atopobiaceae bacterium]